MKLIKLNLNYESKLIISDGANYLESVRENPEYFKIKNEYLRLIENYREKPQDQFVGGMPVQLEHNCLKQLFRINPKNNELVYSITLKVDGERFLMFLGSDGIIYLIDRSTNFYYLEDTQTHKKTLPLDLGPMILDGELVEHSKGVYEYFVFDILFFKGHSVIMNDYPNRYLFSKMAVEIVNKTIPCSLKQWFPITDILKTNNIYKYIIDQTNKNRNPKLKADGLILQPNDGIYVTFREWNRNDNVQFKWKPPDELTLDFKIKVVSKNMWLLLTQTGQQFMINQVVGNPLPATCEPTETEQKNINYYDGAVVEFKYQTRNNPQGNLFKPYRPRPEKKANSYQTILSTLNVIKNPFYLDGIKNTLLSITTDKINTNAGVKELLLKYSKSDLILCCIDLFFTDSEKGSIKKIYNYYIKKENEIIEEEINNPQTEIIVEQKNLLKTSVRRPFIKTKKTIIEREAFKDYELEFRIFNGGKKNKSLNKLNFFYLLDFLWKKFPINYSYTIDIYLNKYDSKKYRSTYNSFEDIYNLNPFTNKYKQTVQTFTLKENDEKLYNNMVFKLDLSIEKDSDKIIGINTKIDENNTVTNLIRTKNRKSFKINELWRIDMTIVKTGYEISKITEQNEIYELECEYVGPADVSFEIFIESMSDLYKMILNNSSYC